MTSAFVSGTRYGQRMHIALVFFLIVALLPLHPAQAVNQPLALAIIDTGFDTSIPVVKKAVAHEVCILDWSMCPNGDSTQEGIGSAGISDMTFIHGGISHGTQMVSIAVESNPGQKLVLIKLIAYNSRGQRLPVYDGAIVRAFRWVLEHKSEFNIGAVAMAQGHHSLLSAPTYCPKNLELEKLISQLKAINTPVFFPAGNSADKLRVDWPACIPAAISIGAVDKDGSIARYSNYDRNLHDFYAHGYASALLPGGVRTVATGTSVSTIIAASYWMHVVQLRPDLAFSEVMQLFRSTGSIIFDSKFRYGRKIELESALQTLKQR